MPSLFRYIFFLSILWNVKVSCAQPYQFSRQFTIENGLPSHHIYEMIQDRYGYLWIGTENGISKFDGKYFTNYSVRDGLPSNDVVSMRIDGSGMLWVNCFRQLPTYFNESIGAFEVVKDSIVVSDVNTTYKIGLTENGQVLYTNQIGHNFTFYNKKLIANYSSVKYCVIADRFTMSIKDLKMRDSSLQIELWKDKQLADSQTIQVENGYWLSFYHDTSFFLRYKQHLIKINIENDKLAICQLYTNNYFIQVAICNNRLILIDDKNLVHIFQLKDLKLIEKVQGPEGSNSVWIDSNNQCWIGTKENGLYCYTKNGSVNYFNNEEHRNFLSVFSTHKNQILAGNKFGEVLCQDKEVISKKKVSEFGWIRNMFEVQKKLYVVSDDGFYVSVKGSYHSEPIYTQPLGIKTGFAVNDSIFFFGTLAGAIFYNANTQKGTLGNSKIERVYSGSVLDTKSVCYISNGKVYIGNWTSNLHNQVPIQFGDKETPQLLTTDDHKLVWIATNFGNVYIYTPQSKLFKIAYQVTNIESINHLLHYKNNIYMASKDGLVIINYTYFKHALNYTTSIFTTADGLLSSNINQIFGSGDSLLLATDNGVCKISADIKHTSFSIQPHVQQISLDGSVVALKSDYKLSPGAHSVSIVLSGVDLTGHFKYFKYRLDPLEPWRLVERNQLNMIASKGITTLYLQAYDINNKPHHAQLQLTFDVAIPFFETIWFWSLLIASIMTFIFWFYYQQSNAKRQLVFDQQLLLEKQRQAITADLHDEIGSTLSSLQLNSAVATKQIDRDITQTKIVLEKIEKQTKNLAEKLGDMIWSMKPGKEEFLSLENRIKNYAHDILGSLEITYTLKFGQGIDEHLHDIHVRKNIVLILKEAINNAAKYSNANHIHIEVINKIKHLELHVKDDGIGFADNRIGNGLQSMRMRAEELGGSFSIRSVIQKGTEIIAKIPITSIRDIQHQKIK